MTETTKITDFKALVAFRGRIAFLPFGRAALALTWLYHGLWLKLLGGSSHQAAVIAAAPGLGGTAGYLVLLVLGVVETALAVWVITGYRPRLAAAFQTVLLLAMNAGGLLWGRLHIADPAGMVIQNLVFLALVWSAAETQRQTRVV